jgi:hypothetical protein
VSAWIELAEWAHDAGTRPPRCGKNMGAIGGRYFWVEITLPTEPRGRRTTGRSRDEAADRMLRLHIYTEVDVNMRDWLDQYVSLPDSAAG